MVSNSKRIALEIADLPRKDQEAIFDELAKRFKREAEKSLFGKVMLSIAVHNCHSLADVMRHLARMESG